MILDILLWISYFLTLYTLVYWILLYVDGQQPHHEALPKKKPKTWPGVTVAVPAYNEEMSLGKTLDSLLALEYPKNKLRIIVVDDGSTDNTRKIGEKYARKHPGITYLHQPNAGKANALNHALNKAKTEYFSCLDADSFVEPQSAKEMIMSFEADKDLQICTPVMLVTQPRTLAQKMQRLEYIAAMLLVRMMASIDSNYVAPGPFSMYRTSTIRELGGFDEDNLVEDQEIAYRVQANHGKIRQVESARVETIAPATWRGLTKQRNRWMKGTLLNLIEYRKMLFNPSYGDFGSFMMPLTLLTFFLAVIALGSVVGYTIWPIIQQIKRLWLVGFDIGPYLRNWQWDYTLLDPSYPSLLIIWMMLAVSVFLLYTAGQYFNESLRRHGSFYIIPYFFAYFLVLAIVAVQVLIEVLVGKKQRW